MTETVKDWNPNNQLITRNVVEGILKRVLGTDIRIYDLRKYQLAFVHKSVYKRDISPPTDQVLREIMKSHTNRDDLELVRKKFGTWNLGDPVIFTQTYEALEFVGDGWVNAVVGDYLYNRFPKQNEGFLTKLKQNIVCKNGLSSISKYLGFDKWLILSSRNERKYGRDTPSYLEDVFEAFCAAIKQDLGLQILEGFVKNVIQATIDFQYLITTDTNHKDTLMRLFQDCGWSHPKYAEISRKTVVDENDRERKIYTAGVVWFDVFEDVEAELRKKKGSTTTLGVFASDGTRWVSMGSGNTKKEAEKAAAKNAIEMFKILYD